MGVESVDVDGQDQSQHLNHQSNAKKWKGNGVCGIMNVEKMVFVSNLGKLDHLNLTIQTRSQKFQ